MTAIVALLSLPIMVLNLLGALVGGIWLAVSGEWSLVVFGLTAILFGHFVVSILLAPSMILVVPLSWAASRGHVALMAIMAIPSVLWTYLVLAGWCLGCFFFCLQNGDEGTLVPRLLWAYAIATGPWTYLASQESRADPNTPALTTAFFAQVGCIAMMIIAYVSDGDPDNQAMYWGLGVPLGIALVFQALLVAFAALEERRKIQL